MNVDRITTVAGVYMAGRCRNEQLESLEGFEGGGRTFDAPSATGSVDVFVRGTDNRVSQNHFVSGTRWDKWNPVDGMTTPSAPATTVLGGALYVFVRGMDDLIHFNRFVGNWEGWEPVPGGERTQDAPGVAAGVLAVRRADGAIRFNTFDGPTSWRGWDDVPDGENTLRASYYRFRRGLLSVRARNRQRHLLQEPRLRPPPVGRVAEVAGGGKTPSAPAVARGLVLVRGTDDELHHNSFYGTDSWTGWERVPNGGKTPSAPTLAHTPGFFVAVVRGTDDAIYSNFLS